MRRFICILIASLAPSFASACPSDEAFDASRAPDPVQRVERLRAVLNRPDLQSCFHLERDLIARSAAQEIAGLHDQTGDRALLEESLRAKPTWHAYSRLAALSEASSAFPEAEAFYLEAVKDALFMAAERDRGNHLRDQLPPPGRIDDWRARRSALKERGCAVLPEARTAYLASDPRARIAGLEQAASDDRAISCSPEAREQMRRWLALVHLQNDGRRLDPAGLDSARTAYGRHWRVQFALGERARLSALQLQDPDARIERYGAAADHYRQALDDMDYLTRMQAGGYVFGHGASDAEDRPASEADRQRMQAFLDEMQLLAGRMGVSGGRAVCVFSESAPGQAPAVYPVTFGHDSTEMDAKGRTAAQTLLSCLLGLPQETGELAVVGHADPSGSERPGADAYNCKLSHGRASAIVAFLQAGGVRTPMRAVGRGFRDPYAPQTGATYPRDEHYRLQRRVEVDVPRPNRDARAFGHEKNCP